MSSRQAVTYVPNLPIEPLNYQIDPEKLSVPAMLEAITGLVCSPLYLARPSALHPIPFRGES